MFDKIAARLYKHTYYLVFRREITVIIKLCKECGLPFEPRSSRQSFCKGDHYRPCLVCKKKLVLVKCLSGGPRCCSSECAVKLRNDTCINKFCSMII